MTNLKQTRHSLALTQAAMAQRLAMTESHYRKLETGRAPVNKRVAMLIELVKGGRDGATY
jgi:transcriptional regulator with XRE-family HTH domain